MIDIKDIISEKWHNCIGCKYNNYETKNKIGKNDYQLFNCNANYVDFECKSIPELYPDKLLEDKSIDEFFYINKEVEDSNVKQIYLVDIISEIDENIRTLFVISNDINFLKDKIGKLLKSKKFKNNKIFRIRSVNNLLKNHNVLICDKKIEKIVYPKIDIEMDHQLKKIKMEEMVLQIERNCKDEIKKSNNIFKMDLDNSTYKEIEDENSTKVER